MPYTAYAATMQAVWFSHDEGSSWSRLLTPTGGVYNEARCWCVTTHAKRPGELLAGTDLYVEDCSTQGYEVAVRNVLTNTTVDAQALSERVQREHSLATFPERIFGKLETHG